MKFAIMAAGGSGSSKEISQTTSQGQNSENETSIGEERAQTKTRVKLGKSPCQAYFTDKIVNGVKKKVCNVITSRGSPCLTETVNSATTQERHLSRIHGIDVAAEKAAAKQAVIASKEAKAPTVLRIPSTESTGGTPSIAHYVSKLDVPAVKKLSKNDIVQKNFNNKLAALIGTSALPVSLSENEHFVDLIQAINPAVTVPSRSKVGSEVKKLYDGLMIDIKAGMSGSRKVAVTADLWTTKGCKSSFLGMTSHYFDPTSQTRRKQPFACIEVHGSHTGETIARLIAACLKEKNIQFKISRVLCDSGSNMLRAVRLLNTETEYLFDIDDQEDIMEESVDDENSDNDESDLREREIQANAVMQREAVTRGNCTSHALQVWFRKSRAKL